MKNIALIPTKQRHDLLAPLVSELLDQGELDHLLIYDNTDEQSIHRWLPPVSDVLRILDGSGMTIYQMWNQGWDYALTLATEVNLAILNDDITIPSEFIGRMALALRSNPEWWLVYPDYSLRVADDLQWDEPPRETRGSYKDGGMCGWAFMVRAEKRRAGLPRIDEQFEWWCGDDDLAHQIELMGGRQGRIVGLPLDHIHEASAALRPDHYQICMRDKERYIKKYGKAAWPG